VFTIYDKIKIQAIIYLAISRICAPTFILGIHKIEINCFMNLITKKLERFKSPTALAIMSQFNSKYIYIYQPRTHLSKTLFFNHARACLLMASFLLSNKTLRLQGILNCCLECNPRRNFFRL
jgi:hypothetical protein